MSDNRELKHREANVELLRIIAMLFNIMGHMVGQAGIWPTLSGASGIVTGILSSGSRIGVNIFLIISLWFIVDEGIVFKCKDVLRIHYSLADDYFCYRNTHYRVHAGYI